MRQNVWEVLCCNNGQSNDTGDENCIKILTNICKLVQIHALDYAASGIDNINIMENVKIMCVCVCEILIIGL